MIADRSSARRLSGWLLLIGLACAAALRAWKKGSANEPEWAYHRLAASTSFEGGLSVHNPGYLPGFSALMRPFFLLPDGVGLALFIALGLLAAGCLFLLVWRECAAIRPGMPARPGPWHGLWFAAPLYLAIQNNQVMAQMMVLAVAGFLLVRAGRWFWGAAALALSITLKTFPLALGLYFLLKRRWRDALCLGLLAGALTLLLGAWVYGPGSSLDLHLGWPERAGGQDPANLLRGQEPRFFHDNQSVAAWIVRSAPWVGNGAALAAGRAAFWGSLLLVAWVCLRPERRGHMRWDELALWIAWIVFASPFGRYYYAIMLLPAWVCLAYPGAPRPAGRADPLPWLGRALPVLAWFSRGSGAYPVLCGLTFALILRQVWLTRVPAPAGASPLEHEHELSLGG